VWHAVVVAVEFDVVVARRRFGYRRIHDLLRPPGVNHKRVYRLYSEANLAVRRRKKAKRPASERVPLQLPKVSIRSGAWTSSATAWPVAGASSA
jgi:hypothetical protein